MAKPQLIWINLPGADWALLHPLLDAGALPRLAQLIDTGSIAKLLSGPLLRFPTAAMSLATGAPAEQHGIVTPLVEDASGPIGLRTVDRRDLRVPPVWEVAAAAGVSSAAVGWPVTHPTVAAENLLVVSDAFADPVGTTFDAWPFDGQAVSDPDLHSIFHDLRLHPGDVSGDMLTPFLDRPDTIDGQSDERLVHLVRVLARTLTLHGAATWIAEHRKPAFLAINFDLVDFLSAVFLQYSAPRMGHVSRADHARFARVVDGAYAMFDIMLARYLELAGAGARVVITSDHGYAGGALRKRPADMRGGKLYQAYRNTGILCAAGPGIAPDRLMTGAVSTDVAPTLLALLGLGASPDMAGRRMSDVLVHPPAEEAALPDAPLPLGPAPTSDSVLQRVLAWTRAGHLPDLPENRDAARERVLAERLEALARLSVTADRPAEALSHLAELLTLAPGHSNGYILAAQCHVALKDAEAAAAALDTAEDLGSTHVMIDFLRGRIAGLRDDPEAARAYFACAAAIAPKTAGGGKLLASIGWAQLHLGAHDAATETFEAALAINNTAPGSLGGLGAAHLNRQRYDQALSCLQQALAAGQHQPQVEARRGFALLGLGRLSEARSALQTALSLSPGLGLATDGLRKLDRITAGTAIEALSQTERTTEMET